MSNGAADAGLEARVESLERRMADGDARLLAELRELRAELRDFKSAFAEESVRLYSAVTAALDKEK